MVVYQHLIDCTCVNGICDDGPMGSGQCVPGSCDVGFIGDNCDVGIPHCGILNSICHLYASCQLINNTETLVAILCKLHGSIV